MLLAEGLLDPVRPRESRFFDLIAFGGPMYNVFEEHEVAVILDWLESLTASPGCVEPVEDAPPSSDTGVLVKQVIEALAPRAGNAHAGITLVVGAEAVPLADLVGRPEVLMAAMVSNGWVVPGAPLRSMFLTRIASNGGPMDGVLNDQQRAAFEAWVSAGAPAPTSNGAPGVFALARRVAPGEQVAETFAAEAADVSELHWRRPFIGQGGVH